MMTIAFAMLTQCPEPRDLADFVSKPRVYRMIHYRPDSESIDAVVQLLYVFCAASSCSRREISHTTHIQCKRELMP